MDRNIFTGECVAFVCCHCACCCARDLGLTAIARQVRGVYSDWSLRL
jgi:hypothetical protein